METLNKLKENLEDVEQQTRQLLQDTLSHRYITVDEMIKLYQAVRQAQKVADDIEINYTE